MGNDTNATIVEFAHADGNESFREGETPQDSSWVSGQIQAEQDLTHPDTFSWSSATELTTGSNSVETNTVELDLAPPSAEEVAVVGVAFVTAIPEPTSTVWFGLCALSCMMFSRRKRR